MFYDLISLEAMLRELAAAYKRTNTPVLPNNRRDQVIAALTFAVIDFEACEEYERVLTRVLTEFEIDGVAVLNGADTQLPQEQFEKTGFAEFSDDLLAECALQTPTIKAMSVHLSFDDNDLGPWFFAAVEQMEAIHRARNIPPKAERGTGAVADRDDVYERPT